MKFENLLWMFDNHKLSKMRWLKKHRLVKIIDQTPAEAKLLYHYASKCSDCNIVELGRKCGGSAIVMAAAIRDAGGKGCVYSIDFSEDSYNIAQKMIHKYLKYIILVQSDSRVYPFDHELDNVSLVLFDAIHNCEIAKEFEVWYDRIMTGGYMIVHDYGCVKKYPGMDQSVNDFIRTHNLRISDKIGRIIVIPKTGV